MSERQGRARGVILRATGTGMAATAVLALLVLGCVFVAIAGPRESLATQTQALRKTFAATSPLAASIQVTASWNQFTADLPSNYSAAQQNVLVSNQQISEVRSQLRQDLSGDGVPLALPGTDFGGMTSVAEFAKSGAAEDAAHLNGYPVRLEVVYRDPFTSYTSLAAGRYPGSGSGMTFQVAVTRQTAARLGLHVGSTVVISTSAGDVTLDVTGIITQRSPGAAFWTSDPAAAAPSLVYREFTPLYWVGGVFVGPAETGQLQQVLGGSGITLQWQFPATLASADANQAQALYTGLTRATTLTPPLSGDVAGTAGALTITTGLLTPLSTFIATQSAVSDVAWLLFASLTVIAAAVILLAARMLAVHRAAEFTLLRARGASLRQIAGLALRGCALACLPAAAAGAALAVALIPHAPAPAAWWLGGITLFAALAGPAAIAAWRHRLRRRKAGRHRTPLRRLVAEAALCAAAIAGIIVFRSQQAATGSGGINLYTATAPVLVAIPAVVITARLYPLVLRGLLRIFGRRAGATGFVGLARAARTSLTPTLPAFALVLALTLAAFAGMVRDAITRGEIAASWQAAGADALIGTGDSGATVTPEAQRAIDAVPGVHTTAAVWTTGWTLPDNQQVTAIAVDPASYAALVASTQTWPQIPAAKLALRAGQPAPVLASPSVAAELAGGGTVTTQAGLPALNVRVAGVLSGTPAVPGSASFFIVPLAAIHGHYGPPPLNVLLVTGSGINDAALTAVAHRTMFGSVVTTRSAALATLAGAPLQHGTYLLFALAIAAAAGLGLVVMLLELALGATDRELTLARLATMGLATRRRARLALLEVLPALLAAAVAATGCAIALPPLLAPVLDLSAFTGSGTPVRVLPDFNSFALPLAGLALLAAAALAIETRVQRRRGGVAAQLRGGG
jgi:putative ABC transport system permease protein